MMTMTTTTEEEERRIPTLLLMKSKRRRRNHNHQGRGRAFICALLQIALSITFYFVLLLPTTTTTASASSNTDHPFSLFSGAGRLTTTNKNGVDCSCWGATCCFAGSMLSSSSSCRPSRRNTNRSQGVVPSSWHARTTKTKSTNSFLSSRLSSSLFASTATTTTTVAPTTTTDRTQQSTTTTTADNNNNNNNIDGDDIDIIDSMPKLGNDGIYHIENQKQHKALLEHFNEHLVILKCYAPWCRACKGLEPKFIQLVHDNKYEPFPMIWADVSVQNNKEFVRSLGVLALPSIQFYVAGDITETFACGPSKVPILRKKLATLVNTNINAKTYKLKQSVLDAAAAAATAAPPTIVNATSTTIAPLPTKQQQATKEADIASTLGPASSVLEFSDDDTKVGPVVLSIKDRKRYAENIRYLKDLSLADLDVVFDGARKLTFEPGTILFREGDVGHTFFILESGEVEVVQSTGFVDPLVSRPTAYLGTVINRLIEGDYFGERALITSEPRAASIRATSDGPVTCWALSQSDFPESSVLSGKSKGVSTAAGAGSSYSYQEDLKSVNDKYGVELSDLFVSEVSKQIEQSTRASQVRGSINTPEYLTGVDDDVDVSAAAAAAAATDAESTKKKKKEDVGAFMADEKESVLDKKKEEDKTRVESSEQPSTVLPHLAVEDKTIFTVLTRFQMIRHVSRCFDYMRMSKIVWGDEGVRKRRNMLVSRLTSSQRSEFIDTFKLIDVTNDGYINVIELKRVMESIGETKYTDDEYMEMMVTRERGSRISRTSVLNLEDFMGIMAETEFYHLFRDIFASLDTQQSGFVKAQELDRVLCGVRNLVVEDSKMILDVDEDRDMLIDYEQFTRMLLGTTLL